MAQNTYYVQWTDGAI